MVNFGQPVNLSGDACAAVSVLTVCLLVHLAYIICRIMKHNQYLYPSINISHFTHNIFQRQEIYPFLNYCSLDKLATLNQKQPKKNNQLMMNNLYPYIFCQVIMLDTSKRRNNDESCILFLSNLCPGHSHYKCLLHPRTKFQIENNAFPSPDSTTEHTEYH